MSVFLIWSGEASRQLALGLREVLPLILQNADPFMSEEDVRTGQRWFSTIGTELQSATFGVVCLTRENMSAPWINFEAGAIANRLDTNGVGAVLLGLEKSEVADPLRQFQHCSTSKEETSRLVWSINESLPEPSRLDRGRFAQTFEAFWPRIEQMYARCTAATNAQPVPEPPQAIRAESDSPAFQELLDLTRSTTRSLSELAAGMRQLSLYVTLTPPIDYKRRIGGLLAPDPLRDNTPKSAIGILEAIAKVTSSPTMVNNPAPNIDLPIGAPTPTPSGKK